MKRLLDFIGSRRFAVYIMALTVAVILLSNLLPKPYILTPSELNTLKRESPVIYSLSERFNVARVTRSPAFIAVTAFLFMSITICTLRRTKRFLERLERGEETIDAASLHVSHVFDIAGKGDAEKKVREELKAARWGLVEGGGVGRRVYYARKGIHGFWGSAVFHGGMLLVLVGALFSAMTRFNGNLILAERFDMDPGEVLKAVLDEDVNLFPVRYMVMESFKPVYEGNFPVDYTAWIAYKDEYGNLKRRGVKVNEPLRVGTYQFLLSRYGFAPRFVLKNEKGETLTDDVVVLVVITPDQEDSFQLLNGEFVARVRFFPDFYLDAKNGLPRTRSRAPMNPVFSVSIAKNGKDAARGMVPIGGGLDLGKYRLEFTDLHYWAQFEVSRDRGMPFVTAGFFIIISGLVARLLLNEKNIWVIISENNIGVGGRARYFPALFEEELKRLAENLIATEATEVTEKK